MPGRFRKRARDEVTFEREVARAVDQLPEWMRSHLANVAIVIEDEPVAAPRADDDNGLYALYEGVPLGVGAGPFPLPARIILFRGPLVADFGMGSRLRREIRRTIIHEVGHHFGMSETDLERLGYE